MYTATKTIASLCCSLMLASWVHADPAKAIDYLKTEGKRWMDQRGCASCHQVPAMLWSLHSAEQHGLPVASDELQQWNEWSINPTNFVKPSQKEGLDIESTLAGNIDTMAALMLAIPAETDAAWRDRFAEKLCSEQADDGSWKACGQLPLQKRPAKETTRATTLWVTLALLRHQSKAFDVAKAIDFADAGPRATSTEWFAVRLLVAAELDIESTMDFRNQLLALQNADGGWGWMTDQASDALATGITLYALAETGQTSSVEISKAREFLLSTQQKEGHWKVPGTKGSANGKPTPTSNYWGTAWAVVGLLSTE